MCAWCWGFSPTWERIKEHLPPGIVVKNILGGLAPDSSVPMPDDMQEYIKTNWYRIQNTIPNVEFNYNFWSECEPRRSTYPACRAVLAAKKQDELYEAKMIQAIQEAYYLFAKNPSNDNTLIDLADALSLNVEQFSRDLNAKETQQSLDNNIQYYHQLSAACGVSGFPSLALKVKDQLYAVPRDYIHWETAINFVKQYSHQ